MKKLAILVGALVLTGSTFAQRPVDANPFSLEGGLSFNAGNTFSAPSLRLRYFAADNIAGRLGVQYNSTSETINHYGIGADFLPSADSLGTEVNKSSMTWLSIGGSYHFSQLDRLSPYVALDVMIGMGSNNATWTDFDGVGYDKGESASGNSKMSGLGLNLAAGFDYYFAENVFIGAELGFMYMSTTDKGGEFTYTSGSTTTTTTLHSAGKNSSFGNAAQGTIRLGWRF
jgi:outer membrane protein W